MKYLSKYESFFTKYKVGDYVLFTPENYTLYQIKVDNDDVHPIKGKIISINSTIYVIDTHNGESVEYRSAIIRKLNEDEIEQYNIMLQGNKYNL